MPSTHFYGGNATIAGWGLSNNNTVSQILQTATTIILTKNDCETRISNIMEETASLDDIYMCSIADPYVLLNYGDSGGPVIYNGNIIAINKGTCPLRKNTVNTLEVNVHLNIDVLEIQDYPFAINTVILNLLLSQQVLSCMNTDEYIHFHLSGSED
ncbi:PREDICTED: uncharacterized protein LOC105369066 [Ceratosolen solmsi marchali]|uniref:Uncharacterized protein LOC105369066 n=1 Tax=Ceratosolen solmsi marchali TaxID=326594 RepID=A0AAJ6VJZ7_9HYME|nr:PREDICTED: uncharacterized protein LOC105369066 [Ceratosolen solmsi marchali]